MESEMHLLREQNDLLRDQIEVFRVESHMRLQRLTALEEKVERLVATVESQGRELSLLRLVVGAGGTDSADSV